MTWRQVNKYFIIASVWLVIGLYFFDAANLDDLSPNAVVYHPETDECAPDGASFGLSGHVATSQHPSTAPQPGSHSNSRHSLIIVIDQDSPSLAAEPLVGTTSILVFAHQPLPSVESFDSSSSLYLLNCSLLI